ncbi:MAG: class I SAM-dependent methyltransferase, partial [Leifsonia sp.]
DLIWDSPATSQIRDVVHRGVGGAAVVIDLGCGTGLMVHGLRELGATVIGVDSEPRMIARAIAAARIDRGVLAAAESVPLESGSADAVIIAAVLHLHAEPMAVLEEALRLLRDDGVLLVASPRAALSLADVHAADRASGRSGPGSLFAHGLRMWIGVIAGYSEGEVVVRSRGDAEVDVARQLQDFRARHPEIRLTDLGMVAGLQTVWALRRGRPRASSRA